MDLDRRRDHLAEQGFWIPAAREPGSKYPLMVEFDAPIGHPDVIGGIDRIRIQI